LARGRWEEALQRVQAEGAFVRRVEKAAEAREAAREARAGAEPPPSLPPQRALEGRMSPDEQARAEVAASRASEKSFEPLGSKVRAAEAKREAKKKAIDVERVVRSPSRPRPWSHWTLRCKSDAPLPPTLHESMARNKRDAYMAPARRRWGGWTARQ
jgi:hypothetical protein